VPAYAPKAKGTGTSLGRKRKEGDCMRDITSSYSSGLIGGVDNRRKMQDKKGRGQRFSRRPWTLRARLKIISRTVRQGAFDLGKGNCQQEHSRKKPIGGGGKAGRLGSLKRGAADTATGLVESQPGKTRAHFKYGRTRSWYTKENPRGNVTRSLWGASRSSEYSLNLLFMHRRGARSSPENSLKPSKHDEDRCYGQQQSKKCERKLAHLFSRGGVCSVKKKSFGEEERELKEQPRLEKRSQMKRVETQLPINGKVPRRSQEC